MSRCMDVKPFDSRLFHLFEFVLTAMNIARPNRTNQSRTVEAWWTQGANRSAAATFIASNAAGAEVGRVAKNQQSQGSQWVTLGTWQFTAGWNKVALSRQAPTGKVVIADAIRVR